MEWSRVHVAAIGIISGDGTLILISQKQHFITGKNNYVPNRMLGPLPP